MKKAACLGKWRTFSLALLQQVNNSNHEASATVKQSEMKKCYMEV